MRDRPGALKTVPALGEGVQSERCYACGAEDMVSIQTCKFRCNGCGALLDCEDVSGLPK